jgi:2-dehydro-3-deoxyphosphogluconate aldolase/(4S)-4-hydroxy-2-oxoglutarate aldolase
MTAGELERRGVVAVVRGGSAEAAAAAARALAEGGVTAVEVTYTVPGAADALRSLAAERDLLVGAGTVLTPEQAREAVAAGARFLVAPNFDEAVVRAAAELGAPLLPGVLTATEVAAAMRACPVVKLFPAGTGGPSHLRALRGPFPGLRAVPTGGVSADNLGEWLAAGAIAVGAGSDLCPAAAVDAFDHDEIRRRARRYRSALDAARA